jgi:hypothetical protein
MEVRKRRVWSKKDQRDFEVRDLEARNEGLDEELERRDGPDESDDNEDSNTGGSRVAENNEDADNDGDEDVDVGSNGPGARSNGSRSRSNGPSPHSSLEPEVDPEFVPGDIVGVGAYPIDTYTLPPSHLTPKQAQSPEANCAEKVLTHNGKDKFKGPIHASDHRLHTGHLSKSFSFLGAYDRSNQVGLPFVFRHLYDAALDVHHVPVGHVSIVSPASDSKTYHYVAPCRWLQGIDAYAAISGVGDQQQAEIPR